MTYLVKYKLKGSFFWKTLKSIQGDLIPPDLPGFRSFFTDKEERYDIPMDGTQFYFSMERFLTIKKKMEKEAGTHIVTASKVG